MAPGGSLYVVATPIGNLADLTERARQVLAGSGRVLAEDTRVTATLLRHCGIATRPTSLHEHNEQRRIDEVLGWLAAGERVALVSDAGTPGISDPGARLVRAAHEAGHRVVPIPGASAVAAAVSAAGLVAERFVFAGFLPTQAKARAELLATLAPLPFAIVCYEAPHRVRATLAALRDALRRRAARRDRARADQALRGDRARVAGRGAGVGRRRREPRARRVRAGGRRRAVGGAAVGGAGRRASSAGWRRSSGKCRWPRPRAWWRAVTGVPREQLYERAVALKKGAAE